VGFVVDKVAPGKVFSEYFGLPCQSSFIPPIAPKSPSSIIWDWYNRPIVAAVTSGLSLTPLRIIIIIKKITLDVTWSFCIYIGECSPEKVVTHLSEYMAHPKITWSSPNHENVNLMKWTL
jgi:hypothetical protein